MCRMNDKIWKWKKKFLRKNFKRYDQFNQKNKLKSKWLKTKTKKKSKKKWNNIKMKD